MKKICSIISIISLFLVSCRTTMPEASSGGKEDVAYFVVASAHDNIGKPVMVYIDDLTAEYVKPINQKNTNNPKSAYQIRPGKRKIKIMRNNAVLFDRFVFVSPQETKTITIK